MQEFISVYLDGDDAAVGLGVFDRVWVGGRSLSADGCAQCEDSDDDGCEYQYRPEFHLAFWH